MSPLLGPCPACARHVRVSEVSCPFCEASLAGHTWQLVPEASERLPRIAVALFATTLAVGATTAVPAGAQGQSSSRDRSTLVGAAYGAPSLGLDPGGVVAAYGGPGLGEPERALRGVVVFSDAQLDGAARPAAAYASVLQRYLSPVRVQYERTLRNNPSVRGRLSVELSIEPSGFVSDVRVTPAPGFTPELVEGLRRVWRRVRFPRRARRTELRFTATFSSQT